MPTPFARFAEHAYWALDRVLDALDRAGPEALDAPPPAAGMRPARETLAHVYGFDRFWVPRLVEGVDPLPAPPADTSELRAAWAPARAALVEHLATVDPDALEDSIEVRQGDRTWRDRPIDVLSQFVAHHAQHRAELALIATQHGASPGELDWWDFLEGQRASGAGGDG